MATRTVAGRTWHFDKIIGFLSVRGRGLWHPTSVASAPDGTMYVLNSGARPGCAITVLNMEEEFLGEFAEDEFSWPEGLALDGEGNLYCSDGHDHYVAVYTPDGERIAQWGEEGSSEGQLNSPSGLAFDSDENLLVVDSLNGRVQKFTKDGNFISSWGSPGDGEGEFNRPWGITIDSVGDVYVTDWGNDRVQKFSAEGEYLMRFGGGKQE